MTSFNKYQRTCGHHKQDDQKVCYCDISGKTCNKFSCPRYRGRNVNEYQ